MTKQPKRAAALIGLVVLASVAFFALHESSFFKGLASDSSASKANALSIATAPARPANNDDRTSIQSIVREIQSSQDIQTTYDKYVSHPDPTGEIAFRLSLAMDDCGHFSHKSVDQLSKEMNAVGAAASQSVPRRAAIERRVQRCKGFRYWGSENVSSTALSLLYRADGLGYPGAVASMLPIRQLNKHAEGLDAQAIQLLSAKDIDGDVIKGIFIYLSQRNGEVWLSQFGDPAVATAAWTLLQCNYGTSCDDSNPILSASCIYYAACERLDVASALPALYPSLTQERLEEAVRLVPILASQIQSRDWVRLGFSKQQGANSH